MNKTIFQYFHWYNTPKDNLWKRVAEEAAVLVNSGITDVWLPPAYKSAKGVHEPGYAVYDLYDLGEFDQKGTVRTKYGTKEEYLQAIEALHGAGIKVLADVVLNHKMGGDEKEIVRAIAVKEENRKEMVGEPYITEADSLFTFPGRNGKYSSYIWNQHSFTGFCEGDEPKLLLHEHTNGQWEEMLVEEENGNYDYLLGMDIEFRNPHVREELKNWGVWYVNTTGVDGFRLDALKHISPDFYPEWLDYLKNHFKKDFFIIGEYWKDVPEPLLRFIDFTQGRINLFDVPLHYNFYRASQQKAEYDLSTILDNTLVKLAPHKAITFVDNHDTQPMQSLESAVEAWFKPLAGAIIALRQEGIPCVSYIGFYGVEYKDEKEGEELEVKLDKVEIIHVLLQARKNLAYGVQRDYFDDKNIVGWSREGVPEMEYSGLAVLMSNSESGTKRMSMGEGNKHRTLVDVSGNNMPPVKLDETGEGIFTVGKAMVAIYVDESVKELFN